jgi:hypothetical protein
MWMVQQVLSPCVEDREETDVGSEMFGIASDGEKRLRGRLE